MNPMRWVHCAAFIPCLFLAASGCKREEAAANAPRPLEKLPGIEEAEPPETSPTANPPPAGVATPTEAAPEASAAAGAPEAGGSEQVVALGSGGKSKVMPVGGKTVADTPTYKVTLAAPAKVGKGAQGSV